MCKIDYEYSLFSYEVATEPFIHKKTWHVVMYTYEGQILLKLVFGTFTRLDVLQPPPLPNSGPQ